jgi:iron transport multicopper oxidase
MRRTLSSTAPTRTNSFSKQTKSLKSFLTTTTPESKHHSPFQPNLPPPHQCKHITNPHGRHPFHLHGHAFQVVHRSDDEAGFYDPTVQEDLPATPMRRDTVLVHPNGNTVLRFRSDNPGVWLFHCHIEWHVASGLIATIIESPLDIQSQLAGKIPQDHLLSCKDGNVPTEGNAAGNTLDLADLSGENRDPGRLPEGFEARGIVALVFSILAAFIGLGVIVWYGLKI